MADRTAFFELQDLPDPAHSVFRGLTRNPKTSMWEAMAHIVRFIASLPRRSLAVCIRFSFDPVPGKMGLQSRLRVFVGVSARSKRQVETLSVLLTSGPISRFFRLLPVTAPVLPSALTACCHVCRTHATVLPLISPEFNADVPEVYFTCTPFQPNEQNDYRLLDCVLDGLSERVLIDICIEPMDVTAIREAHTHYLARLQRIQRMWDSHDEMATEEDPLADSMRARLDQHVLSPLHKPDPAAQDVQRVQQPLQETFRQPYLSFHAIAMAQTTATARLIGSTFAEAAFQEGSYALCVHARKEDVRRVRASVASIKPIGHGKLEVLRREFGTDVATPMPDLLHAASVHELLGAFRLPVAGQGSPLCKRSNTDPLHVDESELIVFGHDSRPSGHGQRVPRGVVVRDMALSLFVTGMPGNGKTTAEIHLAIQLCGREIPVLVLECAKKETRALKRHGNHKHSSVRRLARGLEVYTPGNESLSPLRHSLMEIVPGVSVPERIDSLARSFEACMPMGGPVSAILAEALEDAYDASEDSARTPSIEDLMLAARAVIRRKRYSAGTASDIEAAVDTRLGRLTRGTVGDVFRCTRSRPSVGEIFRSDVVIELDRLDSYCASILMLSLLTQIRTALRFMPPPTSVPRLMILISEAHKILGRSNGAAPSEDNPDPRAYVVEAVCQMLAELRALGVGVVISDQTPSALAPEIIKLTGTKLAFRLVDVEDRDAVGAAMLFGQDEYDNIARLMPGQAYFFTKGYYAPRQIETVNIHETL